MQRNLPWPPPPANIEPRTALDHLYRAKRPTTGAVSRAVALLIAAISLVDAAFLASIGAITPALIAVLGFVFTLTLQRHIIGT